MNEPIHVTLARAAWEAGLIVTRLVPATLGRGFCVQLWQPDGTPWVEGRNVSAAMIRAHIAHWSAHRQALAELRLVGTDNGQVLGCGCIADAIDTEEGA